MPHPKCNTCPEREGVIFVDWMCGEPDCWYTHRQRRAYQGEEGPLPPHWHGIYLCPACRQQRFRFAG